MKREDKIQPVGGYLFFTEKDAELARAEEQKIAYLEAHMDYNAPESIRYIYEKAIHDRLFKTPVGLQYLKHLQEFLMEHSEDGEEKLIPIPLYVTFDNGLRENVKPVKQRVAAAGGDRAEKGKAALFVSVVSNILLVAAMIAMFYISFKSDQPNIMNYERALRDKYASWEQELIQREQTVRQRELELKLDK